MRAVAASPVVRHSASEGSPAAFRMLMVTPAKGVPFQALLNLSCSRLSNNDRRMKNTDKLHPDLSLPGVNAVGPASPVQQSLAVLHKFLSTEPTPDIGTPNAKSSGLLVGNHLLHLMSACGLLNGSGHHSPAVTLLRPLEDALDCFAAVTMVNGAAELWSQRKLKPSKAAKMWTEIAGDTFKPVNTTLSEYRKALRGQFDHYMHCSYDLCLWDLFFSPRVRDPQTGALSGSYEINQGGRVINTNAHAIDAHLTAHHLECIAIVKRAYSQELGRESQQLQELARLETEIVEIMERHNKHKCQNVLIPPEWMRGNR